MMGHTHLIIGAATGVAVAGITGSDPGLLVIASAATALLPDIDHPQGSIRQRLGIIGDVALFWVSHRGITHTLPALLLVAAAAWYFVPGALGLALVAGYASHIIADMLTVRGLPVLWPVSSQNYHLLPRGFRIHTGSIIEILVMVMVSCAGLILLIEVL